MRSLAVATVCVLAIILTPVPTVAKVLALVPIGLGLLMIALDQILTARAQMTEARRVAAEFDAGTEALYRRLNAEAKAEREDWDALNVPGVIPFSTTPPSLRPRVLRSVPAQRRPEAGA